MSDARSFDAFASYATDPDYRTVRRVEALVESFHTRRSLRALHLQRIEVCVDGSDFALPKGSAGGDGVRTILEQHLAASKRLLLFCSRGAAVSTRVDQELEYFLRSQDPHNILCVLTEGADPIDNAAEIFPPRALAAGLHRQPWYDLRGWRRAERRGKKVRDPDDEVVRLAAHLSGAAAGTIYPAWQRAQERRRRWLAAIAAAGALVLAGLILKAAYLRSDSYAVEQMVETIPPNTTPTASRIRSLLALGRREEAAAELERVSKYESIGALVAYATRERDANVIRTQCKRVLATAEPDVGGQTRLLVLCAMADVEPGDLETFVSRMTPQSSDIRAANRRPDPYEFVEHAGRWLISRGHIDAALRLSGLTQARSTFLLELARAAPAHADALIRRAEAGYVSPSDLVDTYLAMDRLDDAIRVSERTIRETPDWANNSMLNGRASIAYYFARHEDFARALALEPHPSGSLVASLTEDLLRERGMPAARRFTAALPADLRAYALVTIARSLPKKERRAVLEEASFHTGHMESAAMVSQAFLDDGDPRAAESYIRALDDSAIPQNDEEMYHLCDVVANLSLAVERLRPGHGIADDEVEGLAAPCHDDIIRNLIDHGFLETALAGATQDLDRGIRAEIKEAIVERPDALADIDRSLATALSITESPDSRDHALGRLAFKLIAAGRTDEAVRVAGHIADPKKKSWVYEDLVSEFAKRGQFTRALGAARSVHPEHRSCGLAHVAALAAPREKKLADSVFSEATAIELQQKEPDLDCIAGQLTAAGLTDRALALVPKGATDWHRDELRLEITRELARATSFARGREVAASILDLDKRTEAFDEIIGYAAAR